MRQLPRVEPVDPERLGRFLGHFKRYMSFFTVGTAVLPLPVAAFGLIPLYEPDARLTGIIASLLCFLLIAFVFFSRQALARMLFFEFRMSGSSGAAAGVPGDDGISEETLALRRARFGRMLFALFVFVLIALSLFAFLYYHSLYMNFQASRTWLTPHQDALARTWLMGTFIAFFALAEIAFVLMATKEFLQDTLGLSDLDLIAGYRLDQAALPSAAFLADDTGPAPGEEAST